MADDVNLGELKIDPETELINNKFSLINNARALRVGTQDIGDANEHGVIATDKSVMIVDNNALKTSDEPFDDQFNAGALLHLVNKKNDVDKYMHQIILTSVNEPADTTTETVDTSSVGIQLENGNFSVRAIDDAAYATVDFFGIEFNQELNNGETTENVINIGGNRNKVTANASGLMLGGEGLKLTDENKGQTVAGKYNDPSKNTDAAFVIGNGTDDNNRSNAFAITSESVTINYGDNTVIINENGISGGSLSPETINMTQEGGFTRVQYDSIEMGNQSFEYTYLYPNQIMLQSGKGTSTRTNTLTSDSIELAGYGSRVDISHTKLEVVGSDTQHTVVDATGVYTDVVSGNKIAGYYANQAGDLLSVGSAAQPVYFNKGIVYEANKIPDMTAIKHTLRADIFIGTDSGEMPDSETWKPIITNVQDTHPTNIGSTWLTNLVNSGIFGYSEENQSDEIRFYINGTRVKLSDDIIKSGDTSLPNLANNFLWKYKGTTKTYYPVNTYTPPTADYSLIELNIHAVDYSGNDFVFAWVPAATSSNLHNNALPMLKLNIDMWGNHVDDKYDGEHVRMWTTDRVPHKQPKNETAVGYKQYDLPDNPKSDDKKWIKFGEVGTLLHYNSETWHFTGDWILANNNPSRMGYMGWKK